MFSWNENAALCLLEKLGSVDLTLYLMDILKKERKTTWKKRRESGSSYFKDKTRIDGKE